MKLCFKCQRTKPQEEFYRHSRMADGRLGKCKDCTKTDVRANRVAKRAYYSAYERTRHARPERRRKKREYERQHRRLYPDRERARAMVGRAIRTGKLTRQPCQVCGNPKTEAHHSDYSQPLKVKWLCFRCHREKEHGQIVLTTGS
jgi:hypothetical protein